MVRRIVGVRSTCQTLRAAFAVAETGFDPARVSDASSLTKRAPHSFAGDVWRCVEVVDTRR